MEDAGPTCHFPLDRPSKYRMILRYHDMKCHNISINSLAYDMNPTCTAVSQVDAINVWKLSYVSTENCQSTTVTETAAMLQEETQNSDRLKCCRESCQVVTCLIRQRVTICNQIIKWTTMKHVSQSLSDNHSQSHQTSSDMANNCTIRITVCHKHIKLKSKQ